jgi:hypothetical protein
LKGHKLEMSSRHIRDEHTHGMDLDCLADCADWAGGLCRLGWRTMQTGLADCADWAGKLCRLG